MRANQTHHQVKINVVNAQTLQRAVDTLFDALVPRIVELGGDPNLLARHARVFDALTNLLLVAISQSSVDVAVASLEGSLDSAADLAGLRLPCSETNRWNLCASIELGAVRSLRLQ